ncbi:MAG: preprotein translocase subunit SecE [Candidatus Brocadiia bacterium]
MLLLALFASVRLFQLTHSPDETLALLGMDIPVAATWAGVLFVVAGGLIFLLTMGPQTGLKAIDEKTHSLVDLLIETESELGKVSWPGSEELSRSTTAVLVSIVVLGGFLFVIDQVVLQLMKYLQVLPD